MALDGLFFWVVVGFFLLVSLFVCLSVCVEWWIKFTEAMYIKWTGIKEYFLVRIAFFSLVTMFSATSSLSFCRKF